MIRVYTNADVMTMNPEQPKATTFGTFENRFLGVGSDQFLRTIPGTMVEHIDLQGKTVIPGFIESHNHLSMYAATLLQLDCRAETVRDIETLKREVKTKASQTAPGQGFLALAMMTPLFLIADI